METRTEPEAEQRKLITTVVIQISSDSEFRVCRANSHKESLAMLNLPRSTPLWSAALVSYFVKLLFSQFKIIIQTEADL